MFVDMKLYSASKGVNAVGKALRSQYERYQPRVFSLLHIYFDLLIY